MKVIAVLNEKGGCGKTTISTNLACGLHKQGHSVALIDTDPQGSASIWYEQAEEDADIPPVFKINGGRALGNLKKTMSGYDVTIIDGAGSLSEISAGAIKSADIVLIPIQPSVYDVWGSENVVDLIQARQDVTDGTPQARFIVSKVRNTTNLTGELKQALDEMGIDVLETNTTELVAYRRCAELGQSVFDFEPNGQATNEMKNIVSQVEELLK